MSKFAEQLTDVEFLELIFSRLVFVHEENPHSERMERFKQIINELVEQEAKDGD